MSSVEVHDSQSTIMTTPKNKLALPRDHSGSSGRHSWVHGHSPRSGGSSSKKTGGFQQPFALPQGGAAANSYLTPTNKETSYQDNSCSDQWQRALQAPKKREESFGSASKRKQRAYDPENLSVRAFRLESNSSDGDEGSTSGEENTSPGGERQQAMREMRGQWAAFTQRIMDVQIPTGSLNPRAL